MLLNANHGPDPIAFIKWMWPHISLYKQQREIVYSVWNNDETAVRAGNALGKDYVTGLIVLTFFLTRQPCRVMTTSVDYTQLHLVLWGEIRRFIQEAKYKLTVPEGPLIVTNDEIRKSYNGVECPLSYIRAKVASANGEGMTGHHIASPDGKPRTLFVADEASGVAQVCFDQARTWAHRGLKIGNPNDCNNQYRWDSEGMPGGTDKGGDIIRDSGKGYHRLVMQIKGVDSPNVRYAFAEIATGKEPSNKILVPGVLSYEDYVKRRKLWDPIRQMIGLDAEFYSGELVRMFPADWLAKAKELAQQISGRVRRAKAIGIDTAEGGDNTSWAVVDDLGMIHLQSQKTPDTSVIPGITIGLMREYGVDASNVVFDRGGGGKQHADRLRRMGYNVRTVAFGESATPPDKFRKGLKTTEGKKLDDETKYIYRHRRDELYGILRELLDPINGNGYAIPCNTPAEVELHYQLSKIPLRYDEEGRFHLLPKNRKPSKQGEPIGQEESLIDLIGHSPDELESLALANYGMLVKPKPRTAGALV